ncbi:class I SAM-dependent methyltransferase [Catenuloplanes atrovinosus]|uniref:SAM-dependent methyltransferase n=1 Tax=Catenuloplanes atrovinosus TaxID=137266 RepID=A0AAE3YLE7_9ACTN|nr:methyltransferase domain-containing protein [Catenuloplanes atrovinosus]MDR7274667.1 SAM-dependent methyltransferase [Catenuloplanes atrovinosus]
MPTNDAPHHHHQVARSFGGDAERYDRARPGYPDEMVREIIAATPHRDGPLDVLDVGCGTGLSARPFADAGARVLGVDPDPRMAAVARRHGIEVEEATFEAWPARGRVFDLVVAGQTWHWVDPAAGARRAAEVLRPGGRLAVFWNAMQPEPAVASTFGEINARLLPQAPTVADAVAAYRTMGATAADGMRAAGGLTEPEQWRYDRTRRYTRDEWLDQVPTQGFFTRLPAERLGPLLDEIGAAIDRAGGAFTMHVTTLVITATRAR